MACQGDLLRQFPLTDEKFYYPNIAKRRKAYEDLWGLCGPDRKEYKGH
jgi:hypothetical protein